MSATPEPTFPRPHDTPNTTRTGSATTWMPVGLCPPVEVNIRGRFGPVVFDPQPTFPIFEGR